MPYDYKTRLVHDIKNYMEDSINIDEYESLDELSEYLNDTLWTEDSVTGNGSGSYTFNHAEAKQYVLDNMNLAVEMAREFDCKDRFMDWLFDDDYESIDVSIRCYLLRSAIDEVKDRFMDWLFDDDYESIDVSRSAIDEVMDDIEDDFNANRERIGEESENDTEE